MSKFKCLICGMTINLESYGLNSNTFIKRNQKDNIINCPFCGVGKIYLGDEKDIYEVDNSNLDTKTLKVLDNAMKFEVFNGEFYEEASKLAKDKAVRELFKDLKNIEFMHARIHKRLGGFENLPKLHKPDYTRHNTDKLLLEEAQKREEHAIAFYKKNSEIVCSDIIRDIFQALSDVEKQHEIITSSHPMKR
ncbi:rubrerythrin [Gottschalkia purinilytica]|uniref:Rubrerythrin n=1 Tax=Gottschalkia purinilytica TaxID=1503 RepID=A0A0L0W8X6_GOTPU|nr:ferritin family protein [Gottschalkia purinilytica]KNF07912.1 rubrerythrin [Gottschalkia purinilytica]